MPFAEQKQDDGRNLKPPVIHFGQIPDDEEAQVAREIVAQGQNQSPLRRGKVKHIPQQRQHDDQKREETKQNAGGDGETINMHFRLGQIGYGLSPGFQRFGGQDRGDVSWRRHVGLLSNDVQRTAP